MEAAAHRVCEKKINQNLLVYSSPQSVVRYAFLEPVSCFVTTGENSGK